MAALLPSAQPLTLFLFTKGNHSPSLITLHQAIWTHTHTQHIDTGLLTKRWEVETRLRTETRSGGLKQVMKMMESESAHTKKCFLSVSKRFQEERGDISVQKRGPARSHHQSQCNCSSKALSLSPNIN